MTTETGQRDDRTNPRESAPRSDRFRALPAVDALFQNHAINSLLAEVSRDELLVCIREALDALRGEISAGGAPDADVPAIALRVRERLRERALPHLRRVINATGIVLHTGLGRAPLAADAIEAINDIAGVYCNLEYDLAAGKRGDRHAHVRDLLTELTGAEDALVVNNNAAATYLTLNSLAAGRGAVISRGQLVEIGGSYRMPDIMAAAGCKMIEVGTTNRTHLADYRRAVDVETNLLVRVHTSNFRVQGFVTAPSLTELVALKAEFPHQSLHVIDDLGSGLLLGAAAVQAAAGASEDVETSPLRRLADALAQWDEPGVRASIAAGADVVLFSGDKLLGGPQAGVILGRAELIARIRANPLMRTFRPDKLSLAALEATLRLYRDPARLIDRSPTLRMLIAPPRELRQRAERLAQFMREQVPGADAAVEPDETFAGGGSLPAIPFETWVVRVRIEEVSGAALAAALRKLETPVIGRVQDDALLLDCRTLLEEDLAALPRALCEALEMVS